MPSQGRGARLRLALLVHGHPGVEQREQDQEDAGVELAGQEEADDARDEQHDLHRVRVLARERLQARGLLRLGERVRPDLRAPRVGLGRGQAAVDGDLLGRERGIRAEGVPREGGRRGRCGSGWRAGLRSHAFFPFPAFFSAFLPAASAAISISIGSGSAPGGAWPSSSTVREEVDHGGKDLPGLGFGLLPRAGRIEVARQAHPPPGLHAEWLDELLDPLRSEVGHWDAPLEASWPDGCRKARRRSRAAVNHGLAPRTSSKSEDRRSGSWLPTRPGSDRWRSPCLPRRRSPRRRPCAPCPRSCPRSAPRAAAIVDEGRDPGPAVVRQRPRPPWATMAARPRTSPPIEQDLARSGRETTTGPGRRCTDGKIHT